MLQTRTGARLWAYRLFLAQIINGALLAVAWFGALPDAMLTAWPLLASWKVHALLIHSLAVPAIAGLQVWVKQLLKALPDRDGDGTPDHFDEAPDDPTRPGGAGRVS